MNRTDSPDPPQVEPYRAVARSGPARVTTDSQRHASVSVFHPLSLTRSIENNFHHQKSNTAFENSGVS
jgi:hypothetical protein